MGPHDVAADLIMHSDTAYGFRIFSHVDLEHSIHYLYSCELVELCKIAVIYVFFFAYAVSIESSKGDMNCTESSLFLSLSLSLSLFL